MCKFRRLHFIVRLRKIHICLILSIVVWLELMIAQGLWYLLVALTNFTCSTKTNEKRSTVCFFTKNSAFAILNDSPAFLYQCVYVSYPYNPTTLYIQSWYKVVIVLVTQCKKNCLTSMWPTKLRSQTKKR